MSFGTTEYVCSREKTTASWLLLGRAPFTTCKPRAITVHIFTSVHDPISFALGAVRRHNEGRTHRGHARLLREAPHYGWMEGRSTAVQKISKTQHSQGLINDPELTNTNQINKGFRLARSLLHDINTLGAQCFAVASEFSILRSHLICNRSARSY